MRELLQRLECYREMLAWRSAKKPYIRFSESELTEVIKEITSLRGQVASWKKAHELRQRELTAGVQ